MEIRKLPPKKKRLPIDYFQDVQYLIARGTNARRFLKNHSQF